MKTISINDHFIGYCKDSIQTSVCWNSSGLYCSWWPSRMEYPGNPYEAAAVSEPLSVGPAGHILLVSPGYVLMHPGWKLHTWELSTYHP